MISIFNTFHISRKRLKYKKALTYITIFISSLAISSLLLFISFSSGIIKSINNYIAESLNHEYLVKIAPNIPPNIISLPRFDLTKTQVEDIKTFEKTFPTKDTMLIPDNISDIKTESGYILNYSSPNYNKYIEHLQKEYVKIAKNTLESLESSKNLLNITNTYSNLELFFDRKELHFIGEDKDKEDLLDLKKEDSSPYGSYDFHVRRNSYTFIDDKLIEKFLYTDFKKEPDAIPIIITKEEGRALFGDKNLKGLTYYSCLRKNLSTINKCTDDELLKFQIVGVIPLQKSFSSRTADISDLFNNIVNVRFDSGALIPINNFKSISNYEKQGKLFFEGPINNNIFYKNKISPHIISFKTIEQVKNFQNNYSCDFYANTDSCDKPWRSEIFGLNYLLINDLSSQINKLKFLIILIAIIILFLIFSLMIIKLIIESRKDSAIFRAIGAKKSDILKIYTSMSFIVATRIIITSIIITLVTIFIINNFFSTKIIESLISDSGFPNIDFSLFALDLPTTTLIILGVYLVSLLATIPTALTNIQRNIISDIKHE